MQKIIFLTSLAVLTLLPALLWLGPTPARAADEPKKPDEAAPAAPSAAELSTQRIESAEEAMKLAETRYAQGLGQAEDVNLWTQRWLEARLDAAQGREQRISILKQYVELAKKQEHDATARLNLGLLTPLEGEAAHYFRLDAELRLARRLAEADGGAGRGEERVGEHAAAKGEQAPQGRGKLQSAPPASSVPTPEQVDLPARASIVADFDALLLIQDQLLRADDRNRPALQERERALHEHVAAALKRGDPGLVKYIRGQVDDESKYPVWFARAGSGDTGGDDRQTHVKKLFAFLAYSPKFTDYVRTKITRPGPPIFPEAQRYLVHCLVLHDIVRGEVTHIPSDLSDVASGFRPTPAKIEAALLMGHAGGELGFPGVTLSELDRMGYDEVTSVDQAAHYLNETLSPEGAIAGWIQEEKPCPGGFADAAVQALQFYGLSIRTYATEKALATALKKEIEGGAGPTAAGAMREYDAPAEAVYDGEEAQKILRRLGPFTWLVTFPQIHGLKAYYLRMAGDPEVLGSAIEKQIATANAQPGVFNRKRTLAARLMSLAAQIGHGFQAGTHLHDRLPAEWSQFLAEMYFCQRVRDLPPNDYDQCLSVMDAVSEKVSDPQIFLPVALRLLVLSRDWRSREPVLCDGGLLERQPNGQLAPLRHFHAMESVKCSASNLLKSSDLSRLSALPRGTGIVLYSDVEEWLDCLREGDSRAAVRKMSERADIRAAREERITRIVESHTPMTPATAPGSPATVPATQRGSP